MCCCCCCCCCCFRSVDDSEEINLARKYEVQYQMKQFAAEHEEISARLALFMLEV